MSHLELTLDRSSHAGLVCGDIHPIGNDRQHICTCISGKISQFKTLQLRGAPFCDRLFDNTSAGSVKLTIDLLYTQNGLRGPLDGLARYLSIQFFAHLKHGHPFVSAKIICFGRDARVSDELSFDYVAVRDMLKPKLTLRPARITLPEKDLLPLFLRIPAVYDPVKAFLEPGDVHLHDTFTQYFCETWDQVASLYDLAKRREDIHLGIRLPPPGVLGHFPDTSRLAWQGDMVSLIPKDL